MDRRICYARFVPSKVRYESANQRKARARRGSPVQRQARAARSAVYRQVIFDAAEGIFAESGFEATRMQDVAERAGVSVGVLYSVYASKQVLHADIHAQRGSELFQRMNTALAAGSPRDTFLEGARITAEFFCAHPAYLRMHLKTGSLWAYGDAVGSELHLESWQRGIELLAELFSAGMADGTFYEDEPQRAARLAMALHQHVLAEWELAGATDPPGEVVAQLQTLLKRTFCKKTDRPRRAPRKSKD